MSEDGKVKVVECNSDQCEFINSVMNVWSRDKITQNGTGLF